MGDEVDNPIDNPAAFQTAIVGGIYLPGVIPPGGITGWGLKHEWEVKKGKGKDGATITDTGDTPPEGKIKTQLWRTGKNGEPNDFQQWADFHDMLEQAREAGTALDIAHPIINQQKVTSAVVKEIGQLTDEGKGLFTVEIEFLKWVPTPKDTADGTPKGSQDKPDEPDDPESQAPPDPNKAKRQQVVDGAKAFEKAVNG